MTAPTADFADTAAAGYLTTDLDTWAARAWWPADWADRLAFAACWSLVVLAAHVAWLEAAVKAARS